MISTNGSIHYQLPNPYAYPYDDRIRFSPALIDTPPIDLATAEPAQRKLDQIMGAAGLSSVVAGLAANSWSVASGAGEMSLIASGVDLAVSHILKEYFSLNFSHNNFFILTTRNIVVILISSVLFGLFNSCSVSLEWIISLQVVMNAIRCSCVYIDVNSPEAYWIFTGIEHLV